MEITIKKLNEEKNNLYYKYSFKENPQKIYVEIDILNGVLSVDFDVEIGNSVPSNVYYGLIKRYFMPLYQIPTNKYANKLLEEVRPLAQQIIDGAEIVWNGSNHIARLNDSAQNADIEIEYLVSNIDLADCDIIVGNTDE